MVRTVMKIAHVTKGITAMVMQASTGPGETRYKLETAHGCVVFAAESELDSA